MSTVAIEITKQITSTEITKLICQMFTDNASAFAQSFKTLIHTETKTVFNDDFFTTMFINAIESGAIDELVKTSIRQSIIAVFESKKCELSAINSIRATELTAFIKLTSKTHNPSDFWSELSAMVMPVAIESLTKDIDIIVKALNSNSGTDISILIFEKNIIDAVSAESLKCAIIHAFERSTLSNNIEQSIRKLHSETVNSIIEKAYSASNGITTESADEFEDDFDEEENAMEFRIERLRKDIRTGFAKAFTSLIGAKDNHKSRPDYINAIMSDNELTDIMTREVFAALRTATGDISDNTIKYISYTVADHVDSIVKRYENIVIDNIKDSIIKNCTTEGKEWNAQQMECIKEPLDQVIKERSNEICISIASIIKRSICGVFGMNAFKKCLKRIKSTKPEQLDSLMNAFRCNARNGQGLINNSASIIINNISSVLKKIYNEAYKMDNKLLAKLIMKGVL